MNWLRKLFVRPEPSPQEPQIRWDYTAHVVFDPVTSTFRAVILSHQDNKKKHVEKTSLEWLLMDVKHEIIRKQRSLHHDPNESRIVVPMNGVNGR